MYRTFAARAADMRREDLLREVAAYRRAQPERAQKRTHQRVWLPVALSCLIRLIARITRACVLSPRPPEPRVRTSRPLSISGSQ